MEYKRVGAAMCPGLQQRCISTDSLLAFLRLENKKETQRLTESQTQENTKGFWNDDDTQVDGETRWLTTTTTTTTRITDKRVGSLKCNTSTHTTHVWKRWHWFKKKKTFDSFLGIFLDIRAVFPSRLLWVIHHRADDGCAAQSDRWKIGTCHKSFNHQTWEYYDEKIYKKKDPESNQIKWIKNVGAFPIVNSAARWLDFCGAPLNTSGHSLVHRR